MSTPMTAVATLPPPPLYHHNRYPSSCPRSSSRYQQEQHQDYQQSHHHHQQQQQPQQQQHHNFDPNDYPTPQRQSQNQQEPPQAPRHQNPLPSPHLPHPSSSSSLYDRTNIGSYQSPRIVLPPVTSPLSPAAAASASPITSNPAVSGATRLLPPYTSYFQNYHHPGHAANKYSPSSVDGGANRQADVPPPPPPHLYPYSQPSRHDLSQHHQSATTSAMTSSGATATVTAAAPMPSAAATQDHEPARKRRRSREPDWDTFYRNGLPKEVIVIDDSPEPTANTSRRILNDGATEPAAYRIQPARKRRKPDEQLQQPPPSAAHHSQQAALNASNHYSASLGSAFSGSDRTSAALHTTAPTSLSSSSQYEDPQLPLKRKRTRQQVANEAKRRDLDGLGDALFTYKPPPYPPKKASEVKVRVVPETARTKHIKVDDDDGHYIVIPEADLTERYQITRLLGQGTFGKVVQARDRQRKKLVAVKIIRSVQKYRDASRIELRVLATLKANDEDNRNRCIHLRDCFDYRGHICIVMDLLGQSVFDFLKGNAFVPFPNSHIQNFARQLFTSVAFLHDLNLIHTDLKPENILLCDNAYQTFTYNRKIPSSSTLNNRTASQRRVLLDTEIRLIDFGSATFQDEYHSSVVSTRHYRAPEIILGLGWSFPCDIWSIGCILIEFFTGDALFQTHDNLEHLAMMETVVGSRIDSHLVQAVNKMATRSNGNSASKYFKRLRLDYPNAETTRGSRRFVKAIKHLNDTIPLNNQFLKQFLDLLKKIFVYDPARRITAKQALNHPWFKELAQPDDGTEAARIRLQRKRDEKEAAQLAPLVG